MNKNKLLLVSVMTMGLVGCGGSSGTGIELPVDDPINTGTTTGTATGGTTGGETTGGGTTGGTAGTANIGNNPGPLRQPVIGDVASLPMAEVGGHKLYAGPGNSDRSLGILYANYSFNCDGTGSYETYPTPELAIILDPVSGTFNWEVDEFRGRVTVDIVTSTGGEASIYDDALNGDIINDDVFVVGESTLDLVFLTHILQSEECG